MRVSAMCAGLVVAACCLLSLPTGANAASVDEWMAKAAAMKKEAKPATDENEEAEEPPAEEDAKDDRKQEEPGKAAVSADGDDDGASSDFDKDMSEEDQKYRMRACALYTMRRAKIRSQEVASMVEQFMKSPDNEMSKEKTINTIMFAWMMTCYINIGESAVQRAFDKDTAKEPMTDEQEKEVFDPTEEIAGASKRQWNLLETVLNEEQEKHAKLQAKALEMLEQKQKEQEQQQSQSYTASSEPVPKQFGAKYVLGVFIAIFGIGYLAVRRLDKSNSAKEKSSKSLRKEEKAKRELAKKQK